MSCLFPFVEPVLEEAATQVLRWYNGPPRPDQKTLDKIRNLIVRLISDRMRIKESVAEDMIRISLGYGAPGLKGWRRYPRLLQVFFLPDGKNAIPFFLARDLEIPGSRVERCCTGLQYGIRYDKGAAKQVMIASMTLKPEEHVPVVFFQHGNRSLAPEVLDGNGTPFSAMVNLQLLNLEEPMLDNIAVDNIGHLFELFVENVGRDQAVSLHSFVAKFSKAARTVSTMPCVPQKTAQGFEDLLVRFDSLVLGL